MLEKEDPLGARVAWPSQGEIVLDQFSCGAAQFPSYVQRPRVILLPKNAPARMLNRHFLQARQVSSNSSYVNRIPKT